jgi:hypothetical protein
MSIWLKIALVGGLIASLIGWHTYDKQMAVRAANQASAALYESRVFMEASETKDVTINLLNSTLEDVKEKNEKIKALNDSLSDALGRLSKRPQRPIDIPTTPQAGNTCTGTELYREDAEFLTREAARAEKLITERDYYYEQYERARKLLGATD